MCEGHSMSDREVSTNLFDYATSELSQDAFLCWLAAHANENIKGVSDAAITFVRKCYPSFDPTNHMVKVHKQYKNIDVLLRIYNKDNVDEPIQDIIIEDKTFTETHDDQINRYKKSLLDEGRPADKITCVYYKIVEQDHSEEGVDVEFTRKQMLEEVLEPNIKEATNAIFRDYYEYLKAIDDRFESWRDLAKEQVAFIPAHSNEVSKEWTDDAYRGFFTHVCRSIEDKNSEEATDALVIGRRNKRDFENEQAYWEYGWGYINNVAGGFWGLWWYPLTDTERNQLAELMEKKFGLVMKSDERKGASIQYLDEAYLQLDPVKGAYSVSLKLNLGGRFKDAKSFNEAFPAFKGHRDEYFEEAKRKVQELAYRLREVCEPHLRDKGYGEKTLRPGRVMTAFHIPFNTAEEFIAAKDGMQNCVDNLITWIEEY